MPLVGRDLFKKLGVQITFAPGKSARLTLGDRMAQIQTVMVSRETERQLYNHREEICLVPPNLLAEFSTIWAENNPPGLAINHLPVLIKLNASAHPIRLWQYLMSCKAWLGIRNHIELLRKSGILVKCQSPGTLQF